MCSILHSFKSLDEKTELQCLYLEKIKEGECLAIELSKRTENVGKQDYHELSKSFSKLEQHSISLKLALQQCQEQLKMIKFRNNKNRVIHKTSVSRPQLRSTQMKDKVVQNNSQVKLKKTEVEDHHRISSFSNNKTKSVTTCNDSLKSKTLNVNAVCATCAKCVFNLNHDACVSKFINDVNARTKKPKVVPIIASGNVLALLEIFREAIYLQASPTQAWLWHRRLSYLNFDTINLLSKKDILNGLPKLKYVKDQLCSSCEMGKAKRIRDGENLDKMKEKGDSCILVGYSTQSYGYRVYNKRTRLIVESIHINFDEIKELSMASDYDNSDPAPQLQKTSDHNRSALKIQDHSNEPSSLKLVPNVSPPADKETLSLQELDFLFSPLFEEYFTAGNQSVSKPFALSDNSQQQDTQPTLNTLFRLPLDKRSSVRTSSWKSIQAVQTRRQLSTYLEMCIFTLTVSTAELKNIKEAMTDHAWIEVMQEELHQLDRLKV
ncbi:integrase, catalytic region, zinc finger, CCHC-type containing protein [Tanacetum coccineum]